jgi:dTDP-4-dehydrorhamnose reductase
MRVLVLGAAGMLGHKVWQVLQPRFDTWGTMRAPRAPRTALAVFEAQRLIYGVDASAFDTVVRAIATVQPEAVVNAIGIVKQLPAAGDAIQTLTINALFPHRLASLCQAAHARLIHISTDCVFSGRRGMYTEHDDPDATDLYGRSKALGEVGGPGCLTLRTSIIGRELTGTTGLLEWLLSQRTRTVHGFTRAVFSGLPTIALAGIVAELLESSPCLDGVYHVSSDPISKFELLCLLRDALRIDVAIEPDAGIDIDRSLDSTRFRTATGFTAPSWPRLVCELAADPTPYDLMRSQPCSSMANAS